MSITSELQRITGAKTKLIKKATALGLSVPSNARIDEIATIIDGYTPPAAGEAITFYLDGVAWSARLGQSWQEYIDAGGLDNGGAINGGVYVEADDGSLIQYNDLVGKRYVYAYDLIVPNKEYTTA